MSNKEKLAEQQADDMHLLRSFMQFLNDYIQIPKGLEESYGNYAMNIGSVIERMKLPKESTERAVVEFYEWASENEYQYLPRIKKWQNRSMSPYLSTEEIISLWKESTSP